MKTSVDAGWRQVVLICRKCSRKLGGGFGTDGDLTLAKALRRETGGGKKRKAPIGIVEVSCLDVCPRGAVVAVAAGAPGRWELIQPHTPLDEVRRRLGLAD